MEAIIILDGIHRCLSLWKTIHRIKCPLSSERLTGNQVQKMQDKRILGTIGRALLIAKKGLLYVTIGEGISYSKNHDIYP